MSDRVVITETGVIEVRTGRPGTTTWAGITDKPTVFKPDVTDPDLSATIGARVSMDDRGRLRPRASLRRGRQPQTVPLVTGSDEELAQMVRTGFGSPAVDTTNAKINGRAWKLTATGATANPSVKFQFPTPVTLTNPAQALCVWLYIPDVSNVTNIQVRLNENTARTIYAVRNSHTGGESIYIHPPLVNGWNFMRFTLAPALSTDWTGTKIDSFEVRLDVPSDATNEMTIAHAYVECPQAAKMIFILDRGYRSFVLNGGLARCREIGIPITWAIDVLKIGADVGLGNEAVTAAELEQFYQEGDSISFHGYTQDPTSGMTDAQAREDTMQSIKWLASKGYEGRMWRAAWVQNTGPGAAVKEYLLGQAIWTGGIATPGIVDAWPPSDIQKMYRWGVQSTGSAPAYVDARFAVLKKTHGLILPYMHGIFDGTGVGVGGGIPANDTSISDAMNFFDKCEAAIAEGWLEATTFEELWAESGGTFSTVGGASVATWTDPSGTARTKIMP